MMMFKKITDKFTKKENTHKSSLPKNNESTRKITRVEAITLLKKHFNP